MRTVLAALCGVLLFSRALPAQCPDGSPPPCASRSAGPPPRSLAILYFENLSRDSTDALLADGFSEELIVRLGRVESLQVKSRGVVQRYRGQTPDPTAVGHQLNVAFVVSGTMRRSGDRVRVTAELARASTGTQVWADAFDRASSDLITIEADLGQAVAEAIAGRLRPGDQAMLAPADPESRGMGGVPQGERAHRAPPDRRNGGPDRGVSGGRPARSELCRCMGAAG